ncbi:TAXI family TRAP transporter solute-binding subunit [Pararhodobacter sp.]|uniref:TAXI family TRAP transporter solute-binding subunit n=1 Tax=Pararhodobacter sp. TaxID=2127056 RepID=UPI002FDE149F
MTGYTMRNALGRNTLGALMAGVMLLAGAGEASAQGRSLQMAALGSDSPTTVFSIAVSEVLRHELGHRIQLATGSAATRQAVDAATQQLDLFVTAVSINHFMQNQINMYAEMENAREMFDNLRSILNYPLGAYHGVVWADSGITSMEDFAGRRVFAGPPAGAARTVVEQIIKGTTGFDPNDQYESLNLDWGAAAQAFQDRQIDVYFVPTPIPSPALAQLSAIGEFRVIGIPQSALDSDEMQTALSIPGRSLNTLQPGTYANLVNEEPVQLIDSLVGLGTHRWMSEDEVYDITRVIFENNDDLTEAARWMAVITPENALAEMNMPLHLGAYRYYQEVGIEVPDHLMPPELR